MEYWEWMNTDEWSTESGWTRTNGVLRVDEGVFHSSRFSSTTSDAHQQVFPVCLQDNMPCRPYTATKLPPSGLKHAHTIREELRSLLDCCFLLKHYIECSMELLCCVWVDHRTIAFNFESGHGDVMCEVSLCSKAAGIPESDTSTEDTSLIGVLFVDGGVLGHERGVPLTDHKISIRSLL